jgi:Integrase zinc binding domain
MVFSDHKPLAGALARVSDPHSDRQRRQLAFIAEFVSEIHHIAGASNIVADTLSRPPTRTPSSSTPSSSSPSASPTSPSPPSPSPPSPSPPSTSRTSASSPSSSVAAVAPADSSSGSPPVDLAALAAAQVACPDCERAASSSVLRAVQVKIEGSRLWVDTSSGVMRPLVPSLFRRQIFNTVHSLAHPGIRASRRLIASRYLWPGLAKDVTAWCKECTACQAAKVTKQPAAAADPNTDTALLSHSCRSCGPSAGFRRGICILANSCGQINKMVGGFPLTQHDRRRLRGPVHQRLGSPLWSTGAANV